MQFGFTGASYRITSPSFVYADRTINLYSETVEQGPRAGQRRLTKIPGLKFYQLLPQGPIRALWAGDNRLFCVAGPTLWELFQPGSGPGGTTPIPAERGYVGNGTNPAIIVSNGFQLAIASAGALYIDPGGAPNSVFPVYDSIAGQPINAATVAFQDQYFIAGIANTKNVQISNLAPDGAIWDPGDTAIKEGYSDNISRVWVDQPGGEYLWLFGNDTTEVWMDTGGLFPFSRVQSMVFPIGCDSAWSVAGVTGWRFWLWHGQVWGAVGFQPQRVSDYGVEEAIRTYSYADQTNAEGFCYIEGGHLFYVLSFPYSGATWVFDSTTKEWHERLFYYNGVYSRYRPRVYAKAWGQHIVGDYGLPVVYVMDPQTFVDAVDPTTPAGSISTAPGLPLRWSRICPYITDDMKNLRYNRLTVDMETGLGDGTVNPKVGMVYSPNRGKIWSNEIQQPLGAVGQDDTRVIFHQLGSSRIGMTVDLHGSDAVPISIQNAYMDVSQSTWPRP